VINSGGDDDDDNLLVTSILRMVITVRRRRTIRLWTAGFDTYGSCKAKHRKRRDEMNMATANNNNHNDRTATCAAREIGRMPPYVTVSQSLTYLWWCSWLA